MSGIRLIHSAAIFLFLLIPPPLQLRRLTGHGFQNLRNVTIGGQEQQRPRRSHSHHYHRSSSFQFPDYLGDGVEMAAALRVLGPYFESNRTTRTIKARAGHDVMLDCAVVLLQGRTVSWLRKKGASVQLLTVGNQTYSSDGRLALHFRYPNNWRLGIGSVREGDEAEYQCQLSTHPPKALIFHLRVIAPAVQILDDNDHVISERHYRVDSSLHLTCRAANLNKAVEHVTWHKGEELLPGSDSRIQVKYSRNPLTNEASGFLSIYSVRKEDSGNYSCLASQVDRATVQVHVLNENHPEAVHYDNSALGLHFPKWQILFSCFLYITLALVTLI